MTTFNQSLSVVNSAFLLSYSLLLSIFHYNLFNLGTHSPLPTMLAFYFQNVHIYVEYNEPLHIHHLDLIIINFFAIFTSSIISTVF